jgi:hypothetical protein
VGSLAPPAAEGLKRPGWQQAACPLLLVSLPLLCVLLLLLLLQHGSQVCPLAAAGSGMQVVAAQQHALLLRGAP